MNPLPSSPPPDLLPANALWVELATRVMSQRLHYRAGEEEVAAKSVVTLFDRTRELLTEHPDAAEFRKIAVPLLNTVLRNYTSRWHGWMSPRPDAHNGDALQFRDEQVRRMFRTELNDLQEQLGDYLAQVAKLASITDKPETAQRPTANLGADLVAGIGTQVEVVPAGPRDAVTIADINEDEHREIRARRRCFAGLPAIKEPANPTEPVEPVLNATGIALSGGGIRSATFCLGIIQVFERRNLFPGFDYLSTVSGGGYIGSFLSCALGSKPTAAEKPVAEQVIDDVFERKQSGTESGLLRHLRNNSKYLLNGGVKATLQITGLLVAGILCNMLLMLPLPLLAAVALFQLNEWSAWGTSMEYAQPVLPEWDTLAGLFLMAATVTSATCLVSLPFVQKLAHGRPPKSFRAMFRRIFGWMSIIAGLVTVAAVVVYLLPAVFVLYAKLRDVLSSGKINQWLPIEDWKALGAAGGGSLLLGVLAPMLKNTWPRLKALAARLFILSGPLFFLLILLLIGNRLGLRNPAAVDDPGKLWSVGPVFVVLILLVAWGWLLVNINTLSPHTYYRAKLCECYLTRRRAAERAATFTQKVEQQARQLLTGERAQGRTESLQQVKLSKLGASPAAPYHLINTTLNVPSSKNKELRGRMGDFFLVSKHHCGAPLVGYVRTKQIEEGDPHFDLGTAMAVSGAAASTSMGWQSLPHFRFLMTLFNVRLGYWLRWPPAHSVGGPGVPYFLREMAGAIHERTPFLNLSDGGHIENLAVYELLRRRCKFIVCVDAGMEPGMECADLTRLQRYAEIDLGIRFEFSTADFGRQTDGYSRSFAILVKVLYPKLTDDDGPAFGWMVYLKLAVTGAEPPFVLDYRRLNPAFPHQTTGDQFFDEAQFEAYRRLGECAAESLFRDELTRGKPLPDLRAWFQVLADNLLPDNDPAFRKVPASARAN